MRIRGLTTLRLDRVHHPVGTELEISDEAEAQRLIAAGAAEAVEPEEGDDEESFLTEEQKAFRAMTAKDAIEFIQSVATIGELSVLASVERMRKGGERVTVRDAFAARAAAIAEAAKS